MDLSDSEIKKIAEIISLRLGPNADPDEIRKLAAQVIERLAEADNRAYAAQYISVSETQSQPNIISKKLVINALGPEKDGLPEKLRLFIDARALRLTAISNTKLENLRSVIAIIDCSDFSADINRLKFEISSLCEDFGFKTIIQDSNYYSSGI